MVDTPIPRWLDDSAVCHLLRRDGAQFVATIDTRIEQFCALHQLTPLRPLSGATTSAVILVATATGAPQVLKVALDPTSLAPQALWADRVGPTIAPAVQYSEPSIILMDYLTGAREEGRLGYAAMAPLAAIFHRLRALPTDSLPPLPSDTLHWPSQRLAQTDPARAQLYRQLIAHVGPLLLTSPTSVLHGDLHSANILTTPSGLRLIDPLPACGPAAFDVARFATDPARGPAVTARLACFAAAGLGTPTELLAWSAVLAGTHLALYLTTLDHPVYQARATAIFDTLVPAAVAL